MIEEAARSVREIGFTGFLDVGLMALLIYGLLVWLRRTRRAGLILWGMLILGAVYLASIRLGLVLTSAVLKGFFAVFVITLVIIFQEELRHLFEQIAKRSLSYRLLKTAATTKRLRRAEVTVLSRSLADLAKERIGALVVITGSDPITRHVDGGVEVNGQLSEPLLKSVFDPHSMGHDGAVIISGAVLLSLGVHLPLSREAEVLGPRGTRHAAALGLSERTDALCIVVSEERGTISVAQDGRLERMATSDELGETIEAFYARISPESKRSPIRDLLLRNYREKALALAIAIGLWFIVAYRPQEIINETVEVPVAYKAVPVGQTVLRLSPGKVTVHLSGTRQRLKALQVGALKLVLPLDGVTDGIQMVPIKEDAFTLPDEVAIMDFSPRQIMLQVATTPVSWTNSSSGSDE